MNGSHFKFLFASLRRERLRLLAGIMVISFATSMQSVALEGTSTLSGRVVDLEGKPVAGVGLFFLSFPLESADGEFAAMISNLEHQAIMSLANLESRTDEMGRFTLRNILPVKVQLQSVSKSSRESEPSHEIQSMKVGALIVYQLVPSPFGGIAFSIKPNIHVENVEVRVKSRQYIRGRMMFADGTPLANANININLRYHSADEDHSGNSSSSHETDTDGYFSHHLAGFDGTVAYPAVDIPMFYTVTVSYQGFSATADPFLLSKGENKEDLVFTIDSLPSLRDVPTGRVEVSAEASTSLPREDGSAWVVNPANGHAYKRIRCESWDDANIQAVAEDAYLVAINDAAEQDWISKTFGPHGCWIGLTDHVNEGEWVWASGEPVTFTNWAPHEPHDTDWGDEDFVSMGFLGKWSDVGPKSTEWRLTHIAIIEKDSTSAKTTRTK